MQKIFYSTLGALSTLFVSAQNLVVNYDAESLPKGTGWTIVSAGGTACATAPTNTYNNWTMIPDGSALYPFDQTTGTIGGTTFFSGCSIANQGPFELKQDINVTADAPNIDLGKIEYAFTGYIQTPVSGETDQGSFIVDFLDASNTLLGTSYTSGPQSNALGSLNTWNQYTNTRKAPVGTRKISIRLETQIFNNVPEINVYFDNISLFKGIILPVTLTSFTGNAEGTNVNINWKTEEEVNLLNYQLQRSINGTSFTTIATIPAGKSDYSYIDKNIASNADKYFYKLKMTDIDGKYAYSNILLVKTKLQQTLKLSPNPAKGIVTVAGLTQPGVINVFNTSGKLVLSAQSRTNTTSLNISTLSSGLYYVRFSDGKNISYQKLVVE